MNETGSGPARLELEDKNSFSLTNNKAGVVQT